MKRRMMSLLLALLVFAGTLLPAAAAETTTAEPEGEWRPMNMLLTNPVDDLTEICHPDGSVTQLAQARDERALQLLELYPAGTGDPTVITVFEDYGVSDPERNNFFIYIYDPDTPDPYLTPGYSHRVTISYNGGTFREYDMQLLSRCGQVFKFSLRSTTGLVDGASERAYTIGSFTLSERTGENGQTIKAYTYEASNAAVEGGVREGALTYRFIGDQLQGADLAPTLKLDIGMAADRFTTSTKGIYTQVNTAYFTIPIEYYDKYGSLTDVFFSYYLWSSMPIFVTDNAELYEALKNRMPDDYIASFDGSSLSGYYPFSAAWTNMSASDFCEALEERYSTILSAATVSLKYGCYGPYEYLVDAIKEDGYDVTCAMLEEVFNSYSIANNQYYTLDWDSCGLVNGHIDVTDYSDKIETDGYANSASWWQKLMDYGLFWDFEDDSISINRFEYVSYADRNLTDSEFSEKYKVDEAYAGEIKTRLQETYKDGKETAKLGLMRFAVSEYETYWCTDTNLISDYDGNQKDAYIAINDFFTDFRIIDMDFEKEGVTTNIPVVHHPEEFFADGTQSPGNLEDEFATPPSLGVIVGENWWSNILRVLSLILVAILLVVFWGPVSLVLRVLWTVISTPINWLLGRIRKRRNRKNE